jgi:hypothetical protein
MGGEIPRARRRVGGACLEACGVASVRLGYEYAGTPDSVANDCTSDGWTYIANP